MNPATVANTFLYLASKESITVTPQKLQQLVYCYYREMLQKTEKKLFQEPFVKGENGPMLMSMDYKFHFDDAPITKLWRDAKDQADMIDVRVKSFPSVKMLYKIWENYKRVPAYKLQKVLTEPGSAWSKAEDNILQQKDIIRESSKIFGSPKKEISLS